MHILLADSSVSAWNFGASILTFLFPMILFVLTASTLFVLYTKPEVAPGHSARIAEHPVSYTAMPSLPEASAPPAAGSGAPAATAEAPPAEAPPAEAGQPPTAADSAATGDNSAAGTEDRGEAAGTGDTE